jgi:hypothetical protein
MEELMKERARVSFRAGTPACTDRKTYVLWIDAARMVHPPHDTGFCADCTPEYQKQMKEEGRCENPEVFFVEEDGMVEGKLRLTDKFVDKVTQA